MADKDAHSELKKRARRRLVGAVALTLLAVIVLPMVMDQEPQAPNPDIQVRIPARDTPFQPKLSPPGGKPDAPHAAVAEPPAPAEPVAQAPASEPATPKTVDAATHKAASAGAASAEPSKKPEKAAEKPEKGAEKPAPAAKSEHAGDGERAQAILSGAGEQFVVQLGVFADPDNVSRLRARVRAQGYNSYTESLRGSGGVKLRVRAGPFPSREAAEAAREKLRKAGLDGVVAARSPS